MIVGQDCGDTRYFVEHEGHDSVRNPTNETLRGLLASIGFYLLPPAPSDTGGGALFLTNAILCLKQGGMQAQVRSEWFAACDRVLRPLIDLIAPTVVVTLGVRAYGSVAAAYGVSRVVFRQAVESAGGFRLNTKTTWYPTYHCGARTLNTHRPLSRQLRDWGRVGRVLRAE